jgi:hypothetical protein
MTTKYSITIGNTSCDIANLIDTTGGSITNLYTGFPNSTTQTFNLEKLNTALGYQENGTDLINKCRAISKTTNFTIPVGITKISGLLASGGGGGGIGGATTSSDTGNRNDYGGGGGGGGGGCIVVFQDYPVSSGDVFTVNVGSGGAGGTAANSEGTNAALSDGKNGGVTSLTKNTNTLLLSIAGGSGGTRGSNGNSNLVGNTKNEITVHFK